MNTLVTRRRVMSQAIAYAITLFLCHVAIAGKPVRAQCSAVSEQTCVLAASLGKGINMGGMLDAPIEGDWGVRLDPSYVDLVSGKFQTVRIPVRWMNHASPDAAAVIDPVFLKRVTAAVDAFLAKGMNVIINVHNYEQIYGGKLLPKEFSVQPEVLEERLVSVWRQLGKHYKEYPNRLIFELLNEPRGKLNAIAWNKLHPRLLSAVRESNADRTVMIGPPEWNAVRELHKLQLTGDRNVIVSVHLYEPFFFTHQGISFLPMPMPTGVKCCDAQQRAKMVEMLESAKIWSSRTGYPIHLGEFGTYKAADPESRVNYAKVMVSEASRLEIPWAYWDFAHAFGIYDPKTGKWFEPLLEVLIGDSKWRP